VEDGAWEDPDFLKAFENQGQKVSLREADSKTVDIVVIEAKSLLKEWTGLQRAARGAYEIAQHGDVGAVGSDSSRVHRKSEAFGEL
jgi:phage terminase small subunit